MQGFCPCLGLGGRLIDRLSPEHMPLDADERRRARLLTGMAVVLAVFGLPFAGLYYYCGSPGSALIVAAGVLSTPLLVVLNRRVRRRSILANVAIGILFSTTTLIGLYTGTYHSPAILWYILVPIVAMSLAGRKSAFLWTTVSLATLVLMWVSADFGFAPANSLHGKSHRLVGVFVVASAIQLTLVLSLLYESNKNRMLEEVTRLSERHSSITRIANEAIVIADPENRILLWNPAAEELLGYEASEIIGKTAMETIVPPRYIEAKRRGLERFARTGDGPVVDATTELCALHKNGIEIPIELSLSTYPEGDTCMTVAVIRDIRARKEAQQALLAAHDELEYRVRERTAKLARATKKAKRASRAKSEFLANMSHELRTPLNGVLGMVSALLRTDLDAEQRRHASLAKHSGDMLLSLVSDILDFSKIEAGKLELESINFDLHYLIENVGASFASSASDKALELVCAVHPSVPRLVRGDPGRLQQVLTNLVGNAIKFTEEGEVLLRVTEDGQTDATTALRFTVTDTGIGIPSNHLHGLFKSFSQADASTTRKYGGSGLGLAISHRIVEAMHGEMGVDSAEGVGSTFWFTITLDKQDERSGQPRLSLDDLRSLRVLAVDDNEANREALRENLKHWSLSCDATESAPAALDKLREAARQGRPYGLAVVDMMMPEMSGAELARLIRQDATIRNTVLVALTSSPQRGDADEFAELGFSGWLTKPERPSEVMDALAGALASAKVPCIEPRDADERPGRSATNAGSAGCVLLVEDDEIGREVAGSVLEHAGYDFNTVMNGRAAVEAVEAGDYDLVLMDCHMPEMDGYEATKRIRAQEQQRRSQAGAKSRRTPIIALTASALKGDRERCLAAGMDDYVTKPVEAEQLLDVMRTHLRRSTSPVLSDDDDEGSPAPIRESEMTHAPIDLDALLKRWGNDKTFADKLLSKFVEQAPEDVTALRRAGDSGDAQRVGDDAHRLKGASAYVYADEVRRLAAELEAQAREGDLSEVADRVAEIEAAVQACVTWYGEAPEAKRVSSPDKVVP